MSRVVLSLSMPRRFAVSLVFAVVVLGLSRTAVAQLPAPVAPAENPTTPEKAVLGKILFFEEQLSSDNSTACATCHRPEAGGGDPRSIRTAGPDGIEGTEDDVFGSPGVVRSDAGHRYRPDELFGFEPQVTPRLSPTNLMAAYDPELFWDGRASDVLTDPVTNEIVIPAGAALERLCLEPPLSSVEMAHDARGWIEIVRKLEQVSPLRLASDWTPDIADAIAAHPDYPSLFEDAFGDPEVSAVRVAMAMASYMRTLVPDQTPFDLFQAGETTALTLAQRAGLDLFNGRARCFFCHRMGPFADGRFHNTGIRPFSEDVGRMAITGNPADAGKFKSPSLRNVGLRPRLTHAGTFASLEELVDFYNRGGDFEENRDPLIIPLGLLDFEKEQVVDFVRNGLTDPRVAAEAFPFDRPTLKSEVAGNPRIFGAGHPGSASIVPRLIARAPAVLDNPDFKIGLHDALGGAPAILAIATSEADAGTRFRDVEVHIALDPPPLRIRVRLDGNGAGGGYATVRKSFSERPALVGRSFYVQWFVVDPDASEGVAASEAAEYTMY